MKRHQIILIVCGVLLAAVCVVAGWFLVSALADKSAAAEERNQAYDELQKIYRAKVFPNAENIDRLAKDQEALETWLATASNLVHKGDLQIEKKTPPSFKQTLTATVRKLSAHPGAVQGKIVAANFNFGFDQYLGTSDSLPDPANVDRLAAQLVIIEKICEELYASNILELKSVSREVFDSASADSSEQRSDSSGGRRRNRDRDRADDAQQAKTVAAQSENIAKQRFSFEFQARPAAFIEVLNRLAKTDLFVVVAEVSVSKTADSLAAYNAKKSGSSSKESAKAAEVDLTKAPHAERIVTDPGREPPVNVKLDIDVYSFLGV